MLLLVATNYIIHYTLCFFMSMVIDCLYLDVGKLPVYAP